jgi:hypothetical protein
MGVCIHHCNNLSVYVSIRAGLVLMNALTHGTNQFLYVPFSHYTLIGQRKDRYCSCPEAAGLSTNRFVL